MSESCQGVGYGRLHQNLISQGLDSECKDFLTNCTEDSPTNSIYIACMYAGDICRPLQHAGQRDEAHLSINLRADGFVGKRHVGVCGGEDTLHQRPLALLVVVDLHPIAPAVAQTQHP